MRYILLFLSLVLATSLQAQTTSKHFQGTLRLRMSVYMAGSDPSADAPAEGMGAWVRLSLDKDRFALDSLALPAPYNKVAEGFKLIVEKSGKLTVGMQKDGKLQGGYFNIKNMLEQVWDAQINKYSQAQLDSINKNADAVRHKMDSMGLVPTFTVTDQTQTIAGYDCRKIRMDMKYLSMDIWMSKALASQLPNYFSGWGERMMSLAKKQMSGTQLWQTPEELKDGFPMRIAVTLKHAAEMDSSSNKAVNMFSNLTQKFSGFGIVIEHISTQLHASAFDVSGYALQSMDNMMQSQLNQRLGQTGPKDEPAVQPEKPAPAHKKSSTHSKAHTTTKPKSKTAK